MFEGLSILQDHSCWSTRHQNLDLAQTGNPLFLDSNVRR